MILNQPVNTSGSSLALFGPNSDSLAVGGTVSYRDSQTAPVTAAGSVLSNIPGPDTVVFTPAAALASGTYLARVTATELPELGGQGFDCDPDGGTINCFEWTFTVAAAPTPVITSPADASTVGTRLVPVEGTADPNAAINVLGPDGDDDGTDPDVLGTGQAGPGGTFTVEIPAAAGSNTISVEATSRPATTAEFKWAAYKACVAATETGIDPDLDAALVEAECGTAPPSAPVPVLNSADTTFTATVVGDTEAPFLQVETAPDYIQVLETPVMHGFATDNDAIADIEVVVSDVLGAPVTDFDVTFDNAAKTAWEIHFHGMLNRYTVSITAVDAAGNESETVTTTYIVTTGDLLE